MGGEERLLTARVGPDLAPRLGTALALAFAMSFPTLLTLARRIALEEKIVCHQGVLVAVPGPNLETRAEYHFLRGIGADVVGMSTVPEVIVGVHCGLRNLGLSCITDMCLPDALEPADIDEIIAVANAAEKKLRVLVRRVVGELP